MSTRYPPITPRCPHMLHGGDYNPDQWAATPEIWDEDMRLMKLAGCNAMSTGIFSWTALEPEEGVYTFDWLDRIMDKLADNGAYAVLATPSGARPAWMSAKYPEVLRVRPDRGRNLHGVRHNHCFTSPVYREKTEAINRKLAERYKDHPALLVWHISNEFGGECHCDLCRLAFRAWVRERYDDDLDKVNGAWWAAFWSHTITDWSQIEPPSPIGETRVHGLTLDWRRFVTHQTVDFYKSEIVPLRELTPDVPITTNFMGSYRGLNYWEFAREVDVVSWDNYPCWHGEGEDWKLGRNIAFIHDMNRSFKGGKPFMLMESTPSVTNWQPVAKLKRPGMHVLSSLQAIAHGSDTVQYFQWRKSRGSSEKLHGAVVDHVGHENTRVFGDVADVGAALAKLADVVGTAVEADVAVIFDWENIWAMDDAQGPRQQRKDCEGMCKRHYGQFWSRGVAVDVINEDCDLSKYKLVVAPMLYMVRAGVGERIEQFVADGGTFVATYWSGIVDESDLCFQGGFPGPLRKVLGIWDEEIDALYDHDRNAVVPVAGNALGLAGEYEARDLCALIHAETADVLATYGKDFYAGRPALTVNTLGKGKAYYIASRNDEQFLSDFYGALIAEVGIEPALDADLPVGVTVTKRSGGASEFVFLMNFTPEAQTVDLGAATFTDMLTDGNVQGSLEMDAYGVCILRSTDS